MPVHIESPARTTAQKAEPYVNISAFTGFTEEPMSATACLEYVFLPLFLDTLFYATLCTVINIHIRSDIQNQLVLRTGMRKADIDDIVGAGRGEDTQAVRILEGKMDRESIYKPRLLPSHI